MYVGGQFQSHRLGLSRSEITAIYLRPRPTFKLPGLTVSPDPSIGVKCACSIAGIQGTGVGRMSKWGGMCAVFLAYSVEAYAAKDQN